MKYMNKAPFHAGYIICCYLLQTQASVSQNAVLN